MRRAPPRTPEQQQARWEAYEAQRKKKEALTAKYGEGYLYTAEYRKDEGLPPLKNIAPTVNGQYQSPDYTDNWQDYLTQVTKQGGLTGPTSQIHPITAESTEWDKAYNEWSRGKAGHPGLPDREKWEMENYGQIGTSSSGGGGAPWNRGQPIDSLDRWKQDAAAWKAAWRMPEGGLGKPWLTPAASPSASPSAPPAGQTTAPPPNTGGAAQPWDEGVQSIWDDPRSAWLEEQEMGGFNAADYRTGGKLNTPEEFAKLTRAQQEIVQRPENTFKQAGPGGATAPGGTPPPPGPTAGGATPPPNTGGTPRISETEQMLASGANAFGFNPQTGQQEWRNIDPSSLSPRGPIPLGGGRPGPARPGYVQGQGGQYHKYGGPTDAQGYPVIPENLRARPNRPPQYGPHPMGGGAAPWLAGIRPPPGAHMRPGVRGPKQPMISGTASPPPNPMGGGGRRSSMNWMRR